MSDCLIDKSCKCEESCFLYECEALKTYKQGRADEKKENEQDAYHRGYIDGQAKCSFDNEMKIRADERERIVKELKNRIAEETLGRNVSDVGIGLKIALKVVRGGENERNTD